MQVHLIDGTYEMYRQHYGSAIRDREPPPFAGTIGVLSSTIQLLAEGATTVAYSYIGPALTEPVYRKGTIGRAKDDLEATAFKIADKLKDIELLVGEAKKILPILIKDYQTKIEDKFKQALIAIDDDRLKQEFLIFIQKMDIDEELNRITSHIDEVRRLLKTDGAIGKKLDFMMQELNREANTLGSKSISPKTSQISVDLKVLIEQMREQIQNIE